MNIEYLSPESVFDDLFVRKSELIECRADIWSAYELMRDCYINGGKLLLCGNGGSCADCDHIIGELMKGFLRRRSLSSEHKRAFKGFGKDGALLANELQETLCAINLCTHQSLNTAIINDMRAELIFAQQTYAYGLEGDILLGLSTSGQALNVYYAMITARAAGIKCIGLTGSGGGRLASVCDVVIRAPSSVTFEIQEYHLPIYHALCAMIELNFF
jgi:D-sedoheptulose 7-phosphate isomerase